LVIQKVLFCLDRDQMRLKSVSKGVVRTSIRWLVISSSEFTQAMRATAPAQRRVLGCHGSAQLGQLRLSDGILGGSWLSLPRCTCDV
jgi:hypothetical protein